MKRKPVIAEMQALAAELGGKCLSDEYHTMQANLRWECSQGHRWWATPNNVIAGTWCPVERGTIRLTLNQMRSHAKAKGGKCMSRQYVNARLPLRWKCREGHTWKADADHILNRNQWCPKCARNEYTIVDMQHLAHGRGGDCLSLQYTNAQTKLRWRCSSGHTWMATPNSVLMGSWCAVDAGNRPNTIKQMIELAEARGGRCLSRNYRNNHSKLKWQCANGHRWEATPGSVKSGTWCPIEGNGSRATIREATRVATSRNGKCLSRRLFDCNTRLKWRCEHGHGWEATYRSVKDGSWCPACLDSAGESLCRKIFQELFPGTLFPKTRDLKWLVSSKEKFLELDGYCAELLLAFEYNGLQHVDANHFFNQGVDFERRQACDQEKENLCAKHNVIFIKVPQFPRGLCHEACKSMVLAALAEKGMTPS